jgi:Domain of unknown function (DUF4232)
MRFALVACCCCFALAACGGTTTTTVTVTQTVTHTKTVTVEQTNASTTTSASAPCLASALAGAFTGIPGSAGAGQISYRLRLTNQGDSACTVTGVPAAQLLGQDGSKLPTNVEPAHPTDTNAAPVTLRPGDAATAEARFSPDVPGTGDNSGSQCEPKAYTLRVTVGSGEVDARVTPPTPVCERGTLFFSAYAATP